MKQRLHFRLINACQRANCESPADVANYTEAEVFSWKGVGRAGVDQIRAWLQSYGLAFREPPADAWSFGDAVSGPPDSDGPGNGGSPGNGGPGGGKGKGGGGNQG